MGSIEKSKNKLWNKNFFLLWQGQMVSVLGDVIYIIALDFWILDMTGSTALMGILSAITMLPRIVFGPFAGVFVDKWDRKKIIILTDLIRGIAVTFIGIAALIGFIQVWMVFIVGIVSGICSAFFNPTIMSATPDIVNESKLVKANSVTGLARSGMDMIGNAIGGVLYVTIGAPCMFLFNGISYLFSAFTEIFISIPKIKPKPSKVTFVEDFKDGIKFIKNITVLKKVFISSAFMNFFINSAFILLVPYFKETPFLGITRYGFAMTALALGGVVGSILLSIITLEKRYKYKLFVSVMLIQSVLFLLFIAINNYYIMLICVLVAFACNVCANTILSTSMMVIVPQEIRGKVMAIIVTISMGLVPIGQCLGGVLGEIFSVRLVMISLLLCFTICVVINVRIKNLRKFIEYDSSIDNLESLIYT